MASEPWTFEPVAGPFTFTEGPVWDGAVLRFTDIRASRIMRYDPRPGACDAFAEDTNKANGLALDREDRLIVCEGGGRRMARYDASGERLTLADRFEGKRLNSPNDVVVKSDDSIWFTDPTTNTGAVVLNINNLGNVPVRTPDTLNLMAGYIKAGQIVNVMYHGSYFQVIGRTDPGCPNGFVSANSRYCIESAERTGTVLVNAIDICYGINARLCTWNEWYYACQKTSLGLSSMTNNWEFIDDTSDHSHTVTVVGYQNCATSTGLGTVGVTTPYRYRCCFSK